MRERFVTDARLPEWAEGYLAVRPLEDGRWVGLMPLTFGRVRVVLIADPADFGWTDGF